MELITCKSTFLSQIEGKTVSKGITQEVTLIVFTDNEVELDGVESSITGNNLQSVDDPLFQECNEFIVRFGYVCKFSSRKKVAIEDID